MFNVPFAVHVDYDYQTITLVPAPTRSEMYSELYPWVWKWTVQVLDEVGPCELTKENQWKSGVRWKIDTGCMIVVWVQKEWKTPLSINCLFPRPAGSHNIIHMRTALSRPFYKKSQFPYWITTKNIVKYIQSATCTADFSRIRSGISGIVGFASL